MIRATSFDKPVPHGPRPAASLPGGLGPGLPGNTLLPEGEGCYFRLGEG